MWKWDFSKVLLISLWPLLLLWHLHSPCCILLTPPLLWKIPPFPELPHILPSSLFPPDWSHWLSRPPSALDWLGTDPKIPPSQQLLWAKRKNIQSPCSSALGVTVTHRAPSVSAEHTPGTHPMHTEQAPHFTSKECGHLHSGRLLLCLLPPVFALF